MTSKKLGSLLMRFVLFINYYFSKKKQKKQQQQQQQTDMSLHLPQRFEKKFAHESRIKVKLTST